ncbi:jg23959, partial [Pararge aegeria aegeria]
WFVPSTSFIHGSSVNKNSCGCGGSVPSAKAKHQIEYKSYQPLVYTCHDAKNMKLNRPMSPHLTIYAPTLPAMTSIVQRATGSETAGPISMKLSENLRIDLASNPVKFGDDPSTPIFELSNCQIQLLFTMMIFYCWAYIGRENDLHPLEKRIEENE